MKKIINESSKGITLIALVITIIVLLILAGVAISTLSGENGILNKASSSKLETERASTNEAVKLATFSALTAGNGKIKGEKAYNALNIGLDEAGYKGEDIKKLPETIKIDNIDYTIKKDGTVREAIELEKIKAKETIVTGTKMTLKDENGEEVTIPVGFKIAPDSAITVAEGIVVVAPDGSEFVWVPVEDISIMYGVNSKGIKLGKLYNFTIDAYTPSNWTETDGIMKWTVSSGAKSFREPEYLTSTSNGDASSHNTLGITESQLESEFSEMIQYVEENKGFYVGRYETSLNEETGYAQSVSGGTSITAAADSANTWYGVYQKQKEYSVNNNLTDIAGSTMIWGSQYDQMMIWMQKNGIDIKSKTPKNLDGVITTRNISITTGSEEKDKLNNIYDLLGNRSEWTMEAYSTGNRVYRGGNYEFEYAPSARGSYNAGDKRDYGGGRITLYLK